MPATFQYDGTKATEREVAELLCGFVRAMKPSVVVETGTFTGTTTKRLAEALEANEHGHLWTVESDDELVEQLAEVELARTTFVFEDSAVWAKRDAPREIDLAFVDCGEPEHRIAVLRRLWQKIRPGGIIALHDTGFYPEMGREVIRRIGLPAIELPVVNGLFIWQRS